MHEYLKALAEVPTWVLATAAASVLVLTWTLSRRAIDRLKRIHVKGNDVDIEFD